MGRMYSVYAISSGRTMKDISYFNDLTVDLNDEAFFPSDIYERTKNNPNPALSSACVPCNDSLDDYASDLTGKILAALRI
jgi:hypothetical protein